MGTIQIQQETSAPGAAPSGSVVLYPLSGGGRVYPYWKGPDGVQFWAYFKPDEIMSPLIPSGAHDLGSSGNPWQNLFLSGDATVRRVRSSSFTQDIPNNTTTTVYTPSATLPWTYLITASYNRSGELCIASALVHAANIGSGVGTVHYVAQHPDFEIGVTTSAPIGITIRQYTGAARTFTVSVTGIA